MNDWDDWKDDEMELGGTTGIENESTRSDESLDSLRSRNRKSSRGDVKTGSVEGDSQSQSQISGASTLSKRRATSDFFEVPILIVCTFKYIYVYT